jgi:hypothetical protein
VKKFSFDLFLLGAILLLLSFDSIFAQNIKRTTTKTERGDLGAAGRVTIVGAPNGSISIESWRENQVEVTAEIKLEAANEADLALLAKVNNFAFDDEMNHISILTTGTHDKAFLKKNFKNFPKHLLDLPWSIDFKIKVPNYCDLDVDAGRGHFNLRGVEGAISIKSLESESANLELVGGDLVATFGGTLVNVKLNQRSWRGNGIDIQFAKGQLNVQTPVNLNADLNLSVLRTGKIENNLQNLKPRDKSKFSDTAMTARAGVGGARLNFTVGDGTLRLTPPQTVNTTSFQAK